MICRAWSFQSLALASLLLVSLICTPGCHSPDKPKSSGFASVTIRGNTPGQIAEVAVGVFEEDGYKVARSGFERMVFEKEGSTTSNVLYGNWLEKGVWIRVKAAIDRVTEDTYRLHCQAYYLRDRGGTTEEEIKMSGVRNKPYQKLLDEVARRLAPPANAAPAASTR